MGVGWWSIGVKGIGLLKTGRIEEGGGGASTSWTQVIVPQYTPKQPNVETVFLRTFSTRVTK